MVIGKSSLQQEYSTLMAALRPYKFDGFKYYLDFEDFLNIYREGFIEGEENRNWLGLDCPKFVRLRYSDKSQELFDAEGIKQVDDKLPHMAVPVLLVFDNRIASLNGVHFSDGDSRTRGSLIFSTMPEAAAGTDWRTVFKNMSYNADCSPRELRIHAADLLFPERAPIDYVEKIVFRSEADMSNAICELGKDRRFEVNPHRFNCFKGFTITADERKNIYNYILGYEVTVVPGDHLELKYRFASDDIKGYTHEFVITYANGDQLIDDGNYYKSGILWHWISELDYNMPFELSYAINGHRVIYYKYR